MALAPPTEKIWWKQLTERVELWWILIMLLWGIIMSVIVTYSRV